ncbi:hypothetical protein M1M25_gp018 [Tenacibaculum phage Gundel_1]|uniref:Uncharacterized protein n=1 Tax=Tenacibaculum phage Gundel_1 TaxID=2745672 RepID=A0A8E5EA35_9CAUD|nr:hypothetical protein M1M25_gp018 [Tenacibaculum phage Gundel_1]QQV91448.1 hypothetical protein Gundel1_18 [Tenacibaculum phage Gundel_1]
MDNSYYIITSEANRTVFCSDNFSKIEAFIKENQDARVRTVNYTGKPKIMSKELFLIKFLAFTQNKEKFFMLTRIMIEARTKFAAFMSMNQLLEEWKEFKREFL